MITFGIYNANGREIGSYDSQPTKFAARELLVRGTTSLNHVIGRTPQYLERSGFQLARDGYYRSAYSPVPSIAAAAVAWPLHVTGVLDVRAPLAPAVIAKFGSSVLVALAVGLAYSIARQHLSRGRALFIAIGYGLGTGLWSTASQTLWQHESSIFGLTLCVWGLMRAPRRGAALAIGLGLGLAVSSRLQLVPAAAILLAFTWAIAGWRTAVGGAALTAAFVIPLLLAYVKWFGTVLGAAPMLEALHPSVHGRRGSFSFQPLGFAGLLVSPNRGLLIYSPVVALTVFGFRSLRASRWRTPVVACLTAAAAQFVLYASYSVWWGGFTYGPRYMLDVLPLLLPVAVAAAGEIKRTADIAIAWIVLAVSIGISAVGAFTYPHGAWNSDPVSVDLAHERLWDWSDTQIARSWRAGASPQNFTLFTRDAFRTPPPSH